MHRLKAAIVFMQEDFKFISKKRNKGSNFTPVELYLKSSSVYLSQIKWLKVKAFFWSFNEESQVFFEVTVKFNRFRKLYYYASCGAVYLDYL